jgi:hypothetical protein
MKDKLIPLSSAFISLVFWAETSYGSNADETQNLICVAWFCISMIHVRKKEK